MEIKKERLDTHEVQLTVELEPKRVEKAMKAGAKQLSREYRIPGFRKGKAPYWRVVQAFGEEAVFEKAMDDLLEKVYLEALVESEVEPYEIGGLTNIEKDPLVLTFTVPLPPEIDLGDYRALRIPFELPEVTDEAVDSLLEDLREDRVLTEPVDRAADWGDEVMLDIFSTLLEEGQEEIDEDEEVSEDRILIDEGDDFTVVLTEEEDEDLLPGFSAQLLGISEGDEIIFYIDIPEDFEEERLQGCRVAFEVECLEVAQRTLPTLNDTFANDASEGEYETLLDLRIGMRQKLQESLEREARSPYLAKILDKILEDATLAYPPIMIDETVEEKLEQLDSRLQEQGLTLEDYLRIQKKTREELAAEHRESAEESLKRGLILGQALEDEELIIPDEDLQKEIIDALGLPGLEPSILNSELGMTLRRNILTKHCVDRLIAIAKGEDPPKGPAPRPEKQEKVNSEHVATLDDLHDELAEAEEEKEDTPPDMLPDERVEGGIVRID